MSKTPKVKVSSTVLQDFVNYYHATCAKYKVQPQPSLAAVAQAAAADPRKLKSVSLRKLGLGNADVFALAESLRRFYIVRELDLRDNAVTNEGAESLLLTLRSQLEHAIKERPPPSGHKASYLLSAVRLEGNAITDTALLGRLEAHLQLLKKEQLKIVAHHLYDHVRHNSLNIVDGGTTGSEAEGSAAAAGAAARVGAGEVVRLADLRQSLRGVALPGAVIARVEAGVKERGGAIRRDELVDLLHAELLTKSNLNTVDEPQVGRARKCCCCWWWWWWRGRAERGSEEVTERRMLSLRA